MGSQRSSSSCSQRPSIHSSVTVRSERRGAPDLALKALGPIHAWESTTWMNSSSMKRRLSPQTCSSGNQVQQSIQSWKRITPKDVCLGGRAAGGGASGCVSWVTKWTEWIFLALQVRLWDPRKRISSLIFIEQQPSDSIWILWFWTLLPSSLASAGGGTPLGTLR